jgi:hypothetical protein
MNHLEDQIPEEPLCSLARLLMEHTLGLSVSKVSQAIKEHVRCCEVCNPSLPELHLIQVKVVGLSAPEFLKQQRRVIPEPRACSGVRAVASLPEGARR